MIKKDEKEGEEAEDIKLRPIESNICRGQRFPRRTDRPILVIESVVTNGRGEQLPHDYLVHVSCASGGAGL